MPTVREIVLHLQEDQAVSLIISEGAPLAIKMVRKAWDAAYREAVYGPYVDYEDLLQEMFEELVRASGDYHPREDGAYIGYVRTRLYHKLVTLYRWNVGKQQGSLDRMIEEGLEDVLTVDDVALQTVETLAAKEFLQTRLTARQRLLVYIKLGKHPDIDAEDNQTVLASYLGCTQMEV